MIRRLAPDNSLLIITQPAHAWLAGQIAEKWGNEQFPTPEPRDALLVATHTHDVGWAEWEAMPRVRPDGRPATFIEMDVDDQLAIWRRSIRTVSTLNPYAAILVARHFTALSRGRLAARSDPPETREKFEAFLAEGERLVQRLVAELRAHPRYGADLPAGESPEFYAPLRLLQIWDLLSLLLCGGLTAPRVVESVPAFGGKIDVKLWPTEPTGGRLGPEMLSMSPWPFDCESFVVHVDARRVPRAIFADDDDFRAALASASWAALAFEFVRAA